MMQLRFFVPGAPASQGSKRHVGNGVMVESSKRLKPWRDDVIRIAQTAAEMDGWTRPTEAHVHAVFRFVRPRSVSVARRPSHTVKPDLDKLVRALFDSLTIAGVLHDDANIVSLVAEKQYCVGAEMPGVQVCLSEGVCR